MFIPPTMGRAVQTIIGPRRSTAIHAKGARTTNPGQSQGHLVARQGEGEERLAVGLLAQRTTILPSDPDRVRALLGHSGVVDHQERVGSAQQAVTLAGQFAPERGIVPGLGWR